MKRALVHLIVGSVLLVLAAVWMQSLQQMNAVQAGAPLPSITYLGEAGTYTIEPGYHFIVKRLHRFRFDIEPGPTYTATGEERVWSIIGAEGEPPAVYAEDREVGPVQAGCVIEYIAIDDDLDGRLNHFYLDDELLHTMTEGMVTGGQFVIPRDGVLHYQANDSIAIYLNFCEAVITPTPTMTATGPVPPTATVSPTATATIPVTVTAAASPTPTDVGTMTATPTGTITVTVTAVPSETPTASPTGSPTAPPTVTASPTPPSTGGGLETPTVTPTATKEPRLDSCLRINFDIGGDVARRGLYVVQEIGGRELASWYAEEGWRDSGWITGIDITHPSVYVEVLYYSGPGATPVRLKILNPAPGTEHGWLSRGMCHALEVAWPSGEWGVLITD